MKEMKLNSAVTCQNQNSGTKRQKRFVHSSQKNVGAQANIFGPRLLIVKSLKEAWDRQSLTEKQVCYCKLHIILIFQCTKFYLI